MTKTAAKTERDDRATHEPSVRTAIAVLMMRFPRIDETFILREINELERSGQPVLVVPILRDQQRIVHEEAKPWVKRAFYTPFLSAGIIRSNVVAFFRDPLRYLRLLSSLIGSTVIRPSTLLRTLALFPKSVHLAVELPKRGIKHVHAHFATHATTVAYIISGLSDITYSFTVHGPDVFVHRVMLREKIEKAKFIRAISTFNKAFLSGLYPVATDGKIEVVHSGVNPDIYADAAAATGPHPARTQLLSVAGLTPSRGFPFLIDACARLAKSGVDFECNIVGDGPLREVTEQWIAQHGLSDRVHLLGARPQHEVAKLMGETDIFILPSIIALDGQMDGIPISLMEAMAAGKPVVASSISGIPELVKHDVSGILVDAAYAGRLADAVRKLIDDPQYRERLGRAGQLKVRRDFDIRQAARTLVALFDRQGQINDVQPKTADRVRSLNWSRLETTLVGVRRVHERPDAWVAEVAISDGANRRDVIVRRPRGEDALERARAEFEVLSTLRQSMGPENLDETGGAAYTVPRLLMFDEPNAALVVERADGRSMAGMMRASALFKAGRWLRIMQKQTRGDEDGRYALTAILLIAQRDLDLAIAGDAALRRRRYKILARLQELEARVADTKIPVVGQHGNFVPHNVFIGERRIAVIDFGCYREGLALEDVAQMLLHVDRPQLRRAFLEGYGGPIDEDALKLFTMTKALELLARGGIDRQTRKKLVGKALA
ncbi:MAG TPA: glycosyltransferase [Thermoanaerobaculia bacterium]